MFGTGACDGLCLRGGPGSPLVSQPLPALVQPLPCKAESAKGVVGRKRHLGRRAQGYEEGGLELRAVSPPPWTRPPGVGGGQYTPMPREAQGPSWPVPLERAQRVLTCPLLRLLPCVSCSLPSCGRCSWKSFSSQAAGAWRGPRGSQLSCCSLCFLCEAPQLLTSWGPARMVPRPRQVRAWPSAPGVTWGCADVCRSCSGVAAGRPVSGRFCEGLAAAGRRPPSAQAGVCSASSPGPPLQPGHRHDAPVPLPPATRGAGRQTPLPTCALHPGQGAFVRWRPWGLTRIAQPSKRTRLSHVTESIIIGHVEMGGLSGLASPRWPPQLPKVQWLRSLRHQLLTLWEMAGCQASGTEEWFYLLLGCGM